MSRHRSRLLHQRRLRPAIALVGTLAVLASVLLLPRAIQAVGTLEITSTTGPYAVYDHNMPATSPGVMTVSTEVCNTGSDPLADVEVHIGDGTTPGDFPSAMFMGSSYSLLTLDEVVNGDASDATRFIGPLAAGACQVVYWQIRYPTPGIDLTGLDLGWTVWGTADDAGAPRSDSETDTVELRSTLSASANKLNPATFTLDPVGPFGIGQTTELCFTAPDFGVIGNGEGGVNDLAFEPVGTTGFDPDNWRLVLATADLTTSKCGGATYSYTDRKYFSQIDSGDWDGDGNVEACAANSQQIAGEYCYTFVAIGDGSSEVVPYQQASSGNQQKYNGDFGDAPQTFDADQGCSVQLDKTASPDDVMNGGTLTYTVEYTNITTRTVGLPPTTLWIEDDIPSDTTYQGGSASCMACTIYYSTDGTTFSSTEPAMASTVTHLRYVLDGSLAGSAVGSVEYKVTVNTDDGVTALPARSNFGGSDDVCSTSLPVVTTPVTLARFEADASGEDGRIRVTWTTATEVGNVGFHVYERTPEGRRRLSEQLVPSLATDPLGPRDYELDVQGYQGGELLIEDVAIDTTRRVHGPFEPGRVYGSDLHVEPIAWDAIGEEVGAALDARQDLARLDTARRVDALHADARLLGAGATSDADAAPSARFSLAASGTALVQLEVEEDGLYRLTYEDLLADGFDLTGLPSDQLALTQRGAPVPIRVEGGLAFGPGSFLEFHGEAENGLYTRTSVYTLSADLASALRIQTAGATPPRRGQPVPYYMESARVARDRAYSVSSPISDPWYDSALLAYTSPASWTFDVEVEDLVPVPELAALTVEAWGVTNWPGTSPDHHLRVGLNGEPVDELWFDGLAPATSFAELPVDALVEGTNALELSIPGDTGYAFDLVNLEGYSLRYPRAFRARDGVLEFEGAGALFEVDGLWSSDVQAYRMEEAGPVLLQGLRFLATGGDVQARFAGTPTSARYRVVDANALRTPGLRAVRTPADLDTTGVDYLMIAHPSFLDGLTPLVQHHRARGLRVKVVDVLDVYEQHGHGIFDPEAIRAYIAEARADGVRSVLLVGGDTSDYLDRLGLGSVSFVPTLYGRTDEIVAFAPLDALYADVNRDGAPDVGLGRLPVRTSAELDMVVDKILDYARKDYGGTAVFAADVAEQDVSFRADSERFAASLGSGWDLTRAYLDDLSLGEARANLIGALSEGVALASYVGHSGPSAWTFSGLFSTSDAAALGNAGRPALVTQWGCWNTYHVAPAYNTLGHAFLLEGDQGAAAVLGASTLTTADSEALLGNELMPRLVAPGTTVGRAMVEAKRALYLKDPTRRDVLLGWSLLGDPEAVVSD